MLPSPCSWERPHWHETSPERVVGSLQLEPEALCRLPSVFLGPLFFFMKACLEEARSH